MNIIEFLTSSSLVLIAAFTPIIIALVAIAKNWISDSRWYPIVAILFGIILGYFFGGFSIAYNILLGVLAGLAASGLYSGTKTVTS